jgi:hypothetical protein
MAILTGNLSNRLKFHFHQAIGNLNPVPRNLSHGIQYFVSSVLPAERMPPEVLRRTKMLWTITVILLVLWLLGVVGVYTVGAWIHILLVLAIISIIFNLMSGRRAL